MTTTSLRVTAIVSAGVPIITVKRRALDTSHAHAMLFPGTDIVIVTVTVRIAFTA